MGSTADMLCYGDRDDIRGHRLHRLHIDRLQDCIDCVDSSSRSVELLSTGLHNHCIDCIDSSSRHTTIASSHSCDKYTPPSGK
jgi:hypothetical protein